MTDHGHSRIRVDGKLHHRAPKSSYTKLVVRLSELIEHEWDRSDRGCDHSYPRYQEYPERKHVAHYRRGSGMNPPFGEGIPYLCLVLTRFLYKRLMANSLVDSQLPFD